ncbi:MAG: hypothetical protein EBY20_03685 [Alphaproteobacteria bacterium]|nr:hypothetical protein [Alphaproteobacteria bacterium]
MSSPSVFSLEVNLSTLTNGLSNVSNQVNRAGVILQNPSDYYVSVTRMIICTNRIPLWQPQLNTDSPYNDGYNTIYSVYLTYQGFNSGQVFLRVINDDETVLPPKTPVTSQPINGWGNVFSYDTIAQMVNTALTTAYNALNIASGNVLPVDPPYMTWNSITQLFSMNCPIMSFYDQSTGSDVVNIYFNNCYRPYLLGWAINILSNSTTTPNGQDVLLVIANNGINYTPQNNPPSFFPIDPSTSALQMSQDISSPWCFLALSKIQVVTTLPLAYPTLSDLPLNLVGSAFNNQVTPILMDFLVNYSQGGASSFQQPISYSATSDLYSSPIKMGGSSPITNFAIGVYWQNLQGQSIPLQTWGLRNCSLKLTFTHKDIIEGKNNK